MNADAQHRSRSVVADLPATFDLPSAPYDEEALSRFFSPTPLQTTRIRTHASLLDEQSSEIDSLIQHCQSELHKIQDEYENRMRPWKERLETLGSQKDRLNRMREVDQSFLSPIRRLPAELLSRIFVIHAYRIWVEMGQGHDTTDWTIYGPRRLLHVCRVWTTTALATPDMWSFLDLDHVSNTFYAPNKLRSRLASSKGTPLSLRLHLENFYYRTGSMNASDPYLSIISSEISTLRILELRIHRESTFSEACTVLLPHLEQVSIIGIRVALTPRPPSPFRSGTLQVPSLKCVVVDDVRLIYLLSGFSHLHSLHISQREFGLQDKIELFAVLQACSPEILTLSLNITELSVPSEASPRRAYIWSRLRDIFLKLRVTDGARAIGNYTLPFRSFWDSNTFAVDSPHLQRLVVQGSGYLRPLMRDLLPSAPQISGLSSVRILQLLHFVPDQSTAEILSNLPQLESLTLDVAQEPMDWRNPVTPYDFSPTLRSLSAADGAAIVCPRLRECDFFKFAWSPTELEALRNFVCSRLSLNVENATTQVTPLEFLRIRKSTSQPEDGDTVTPEFPSLLDELQGLTRRRFRIEKNASSFGMAEIYEWTNSTGFSGRVKFYNGERDVYADLSYDDERKAVVPFWF